MILYLYCRIELKADLQSLEDYDEHRKQSAQLVLDCCDQASVYGDNSHAFDLSF